MAIDTSDSKIDSHSLEYNIELLDEEVQLHYTPSPKPNSKWKPLLLCGTCAILATVLVIVCALSITLPIVLTHNDNIDPDTEEIRTTTEYQIKIPNLSEWNSRETEMQEWMKSFEEASSYFSLEDSKSDSNIREQYHVGTNDPNGCGIDYEIRVREYIDGSKSGITTVDIKRNEETDEAARSLPFWPAPEYLDQSSQKCERDEHIDYHKYSRKTGIEMDGPVNFKTCSDVAKLFPYAYNIKKDVKTHTLEVDSIKEYWMVQEYTGHLDNDTKYKIAFTLQYPSLEDARNDTNRDAGEWSIRIYTLEHGKSLQYNQNVVDDVTQAWRALIATYGDAE